ncbi:MAG: pyridoxal phosphate-dependent aminotransferase [Alphaproteobacteria bacterium]
MLNLNDHALSLGTESAFGLLATISAMQEADLKNPEQRHDSIINLGIGQPDFQPADHIAAAAMDAIKGGAHGYTPAKGILDLRKAVIQDLILRHGESPYLTGLEPDRVMIVPGGKVTMFQAISLLGGAGREIIYPDPAFPIYKSLIDHTGAKAIPLTLHASNGFAASAAEIEKLITAKTSLIILNSPGNPTGGIIPPDEMDLIADLIAANPNIALLSDEIYDGLSFNPDDFKSFTRYGALKDQLILLDGCSKRYAMTGWRVGFGIWPAAIMPHAERLSINIHSCVNAVAQHAALAALTGDQGKIDVMRNQFHKRATYFVNALNQLAGFSCVMPKGAFYAFANIEGTGLDAQSLQRELLLKARIGALAGDGFGAAGKGHMRFSFAASMDELETAISRIRIFMNDL